jgi:uncharacterized protein YkwD
VTILLAETQVDVRADLLALLNRDRAALGRRELEPGDGLLHWTAQYRAEVVAATGHYAHEGPTGETAAGIMAALGGPGRRYVGESLWSCGPWLACTPDEIHRTFSGSPPHRHNQERPEYAHAAIGLAHDAAGALVVIELFEAQPLSEPAAD